MSQDKSGLGQQGSKGKVDQLWQDTSNCDMAVAAEGGPVQRGRTEILDVKRLRRVLYVVQKAFRTQLPPFSPCPAIEKEIRDDSYVRLSEEFGNFAQGCVGQLLYDTEVLKFSRLLNNLTRNPDQIEETKQRLKELIADAIDSLEKRFGTRIPKNIINLNEQKKYCEEAQELLRNIQINGTLSNYLKYQECMAFYEHSLELLNVLEEVNTW